MLLETEASDTEGKVFMVIAHTATAAAYVEADVALSAATPVGTVPSEAAAAAPPDNRAPLAHTTPWDAFIDEDGGGSGGEDGSEDGGEDGGEGGGGGN